MRRQNVAIACCLLGLAALAAGCADGLTLPGQGSVKQKLPQLIKVAALQYGPSKTGATQVDAACGSRADYSTCAIEKMVEQAAAQGARIIVAPELVLDQKFYEPEPRVGALPADDGELQADALLKVFSAKARQLAVNLTIHLQTSDTATGKKYSTQVVFDAGGKVAAVHHKFELYGAENASLTPGSDATVFETALGKTAPLICADLYGDPRHHAKLVDELGARVILVSSYWTVPSGARWQAAFAKNWGVYVIGSNVATGPGQGGGIYGPDGKPLAESLASMPTILYAEIPAASE